jgi:hypothetical protein
MNSITNVTSNAVAVHTTLPASHLVAVRRLPSVEETAEAPDAPDAPTRIGKLSAAYLDALGSDFDNDEEDDDTLVERIALGDEHALDTLRERHEARVGEIASRMLDSDEDVRRVVDRVFGDVSIAWPPARGMVARWLVRLTRARCRRRLRAIYRGTGG